MAAPRAAGAALLALLLSVPVRAEAPLKVERGPFRPVTVLTGTLRAARSEEFKAPMTSTWQIQLKWMAREGDEVKAGDPVVRFDTANIATEIESARESLRTKLDQKRQLESDLRFKRLELEVALKSAENTARKAEIDAAIPEELLSRYEYEKRQLESRKGGQGMESARSGRKVSLSEIEVQIQTAAIEIGDLEKKLAKLQKDLQGMILRSRTAGPLIYGNDMMRDRKIQIGDTVYATNTVAYIPDRCSLEVEAWVCETHFQRVKPGLRAALQLDAYPDRSFGGEVVEVSRSAEARKQWGKANFFRVTIRPDRLDPEIMKPGMSVQCRVGARPLADALLVPLAAVAADGGEFWVKRADGARIKLEPNGIGDFYMALRPEQNPQLRAGMELAASRPEGADDEAE
jgi:multidrug efflux pump subunit AcrA (membrane-fusion protein)